MVRLDMLQNQVPGTAEDRYKSNKALFIPMLCVCFAVFVYGLVCEQTARHELPLYQHDCAAASTTYPQVDLSQPCIYKPGTVSLETEHDARGRRDHQDAKITYSDGTTASMSISIMDINTRHEKVNYFSDIGRTQLDGPCWVELWHGKITSVTNAKHRFVSHDDPEERTGTDSMSIFLRVAMLVVMMLICAYLVVLSRRAKARQQE